MTEEFFNFIILWFKKSEHVVYPMTGTEGRGKEHSNQGSHSPELTNFKDFPRVFQEYPHKFKDDFIV